MSKDTVEVYNISSDTESTTYIEDNEETSGDEETIISCNKTNVFLNFPLELEPFYFNNLSVNVNLNIPLFKNLPYPLFKKYNLACCNIDDNNDYYYYIRDSVKIPNGSILINLMESQLGIA